MFDITFALLQLALVSLLAARLKVAGSSVLIHHASHRRLAAHPAANRSVAEIVGILTLNIPVEDYRREHMAHHSLHTFATAPGDPDAELLHGLGFVPGTPLAVLRRRFWWHLVSPQLHGRLVAARLKGTFAAGPRWRRAAAAAYWGGLAAAGLAGGWVAPLVAGFVAPLLLAGNIGAYIELTSRHRWMLGGSTGRARQHELSQGRYLGALPPYGGGLRAWGRWALGMAAAAAGRFAALPGDLPHHQFHHWGTRPAAALDAQAWTNAAHEFSAAVWADPAVQEQSVATLGEAIDRWLRALAEEPPRQPQGDPHRP